MSKSYYQKTEEQKEETTTQKQYFSRFPDCKFWIWDSREEHRKSYYETKGKCCYNHLIHLPRKQDKPHGLYDYQKRVIDALEQHRLITVFKARAAGITELMLRYMGWLALKDNKLQGTNMIVISAPAEDLSISFVRRLKAHHEPYLEFDTKEKVAELNGVRIEAFPSHNLRRLRGLTDVSFVLAEESDFWNRSEEDELLPTIMPLTQKSNPYIALVSTPGRLGGLMHRLSQANEQTSRFKKVYIPYTDVVGKLFSPSDIAKAKLQPNFEREFNLKWGVGIGNVFNPADLRKAIDLGERYADPDINPDCVSRPYPFSLYPEADSIIGVDPGAADSDFAICLLQLWDSKVHVHTAEKYHRPNEDQMVERILQLLEGTRYTANVYVDAANQSFIRKLKSKLVRRGEQTDIESQLDFLRKKNLAGKDDIDLPRYMTVVPVSFGKHGPRLLQTAATYIQRNWVAIHPVFADLIEAMQAAHTKDNGATDWSLDKSSHSLDLLDAYRLCHYNLLVTSPKEVIA
jgi:hypothetical protein